MSTDKSSSYAKAPDGMRFDFTPDVTTELTYDPATDVETGTLTTDWASLGNLVAGGAKGVQGAFTQVTTLTENTHEYIAGMQDQPDVELGFRAAPGDTDYETFLALAESKTPVRVRSRYPNGRVTYQTLATNGWQQNEEATDTPMDDTVYAKQNSIQRYGSTFAGFDPKTPQT